MVIECHLQWPYRYYISNPRVLAEGALGQWLLDTYSTFNSLSQHVALQERILVDEIPSSHAFLTDILDAMREGKIIEIVHRKFSDAEAHTSRVAPYCVKMSMRRWYMLARHLSADRLLLYGLDRIEAVHLTDETFLMPKTFSARDYFSSFFGVVHDESVQEERIVLRVLSPHHHYLRSLPLHSSQREIATTEEYADFELHLRPTYDFCFELLSRGGMIEVLAPQSLRHTSVESMDFAMRRRFVWKEIKAKENVGMLDKLDKDKEETIKRMNSLNKTIEETEGLSTAYHIGASYFLKLDLYKEYPDKWTALWDNHIKGVLYEYLRGNENVKETMKTLKAAYDNAKEE